MTLLAKSPRNGEEKSLTEHSNDVFMTFSCLFGVFERPTPLANCWRRFFRMQQDEWKAFYQCAIPTMLLHDLGKANTGFQMAVRREGMQVFRHEHLSALLLTYTTIHEWLDEITGSKADLVIAAIIGHHLQAAKPDIFKLLSDVSFLHFEQEGLELITHVNQKVGREDSFTFEDVGIEHVWATSSGAAGDRFTIRQVNTTNLLKRVYRMVKPEVDISGRDHRLLIALRAALIASDSAASGLTRERKSMLEWLEIAFAEDKRVDGDYIRENVIEKRAKEIERRSGSFQWQDFQNAAGALPARTLMLAPCGSGKTLAAWRWIEQQLSLRPVARVIFLYPTRATATEGFRDYVAWAPEADVSLMTGTAAWELAEGLFDNSSDERGQKEFTTDARLFAIGYWHRRIFSATVDQFLGFMQNSYASICLLPMLADSVVVIDEVHSFDRSLFAALKKFLEHFDVPVLCMTASLPQTRRSDLEEVGLAVFPKELARFQDLANLSELPRYVVEVLSGANAAEAVVRHALDDGARVKVLWVVNTIARCQELAQRFATPNTLCYHSAFTLADRKQRHQELVERFQQSDGPLLAVTTQVCEMSLDLNADVLVTERAPITSLIQRMGRCNRHARIGEGELGKVYVYTPDDDLPYGEDNLSGTNEFLKAIDGKVVSQSDLQEMLIEHGLDEVEPKKYAAFLECGPYAVAREESLRDIENRSVQAILSCDVAAFVRFRDSRQPTDGFLLPAPRNRTVADTKLGRFPLVVDSSAYTKEYGLQRNREVT